MDRELILILDYGSQYTQLIARRVREAQVYCEIHPCWDGVPEALVPRIKGVILSGGPNSVYAPDAPQLDPKVLELGVPVLGICYGMQLLTHALGGEVEPAAEREFGRAEIQVVDPCPVFADFGSDVAEVVWMSHGDRVARLPEGFRVVARSDNSPAAAMASADDRVFGVQFHPEVHHTPNGRTFLSSFLFQVCGCTPSWTMGSFIAEEIERIREAVGDQHVILGLSGGVDSTVVAALLDRAIGAQCTAIFVDNGLLRHHEGKEVSDFFGSYFERLHFVHVDAAEAFLSQLAGVTDPEVKRKAIGRVFVEVFEAEARKVDGAAWLAQGTLYPDVIESVSPRGGPSVSIKSHHNVGGLPERMKLKLLEPLRELFKDEVRELGRELGLPRHRVDRHPFPGPGLAVRVLGEVTKERCDVLRLADKIFLDELRAADLYDDIWQAFAVLLPVRTVGVMGDERTYENACALRAVTSTDGMTADWFPMPYDVLARCSNRIINEVRGINRVTYDISSKPPGTIEWE
ncbi:MAG: glutamine-hydrolyzing GMP synthase [Alphaproteobacteria bacterium]|nr:glutamine-hydrolyzing GMP synthase [Alphaproteobacteria bacterium]